MNRSEPALPVRTPSMAAAIGSAANYHRWVFTAIRGYIKTGATVLEVGAGHGGFTRMLSPLSAKVIATDIDHEMILNINTAIQAHHNVTAVEMDGIEPEKLQDTIDTVVAINIIEHIREQQSFLKSCFTVLNPGGRLIVFAPAFPALFSNIDTEAGHFRRYTKKNLAALLSSAGFEICTARYFNFIGFWGWLFNKYFKSGVDSPATNLQVRLFDTCVWLFKCLDIFSFCCGQSVIVVGEKPGGIRKEKNTCAV
jgi:SAM-dependent methyltransferase